MSRSLAYVFVSLVVVLLLVVVVIVFLLVVVVAADASSAALQALGGVVAWPSCLLCRRNARSSCGVSHPPMRPVVCSCVGPRVRGARRAEAHNARGKTRAGRCREPASLWCCAPRLGARVPMACARRGIVVLLRGARHCRQICLCMPRPGLYASVRARVPLPPASRPTWSLRWRAPWGGKRGGQGARCIASPCPNVCSRVYIVSCDSCAVPVAPCLARVVRLAPDANVLVFS